MVGRGIPDRWLPYTPMGSVIQGTPFIACKVPLKEDLLRSLPKSKRFGPNDLIEAFPKMGLLVDLTNTTRYYRQQVFTDKNIKYEKIFCPGQVIPPNSIVKKFFDVVDDFLANREDPDSVIVVHCTHGVNRTGYFICRYMIEKMNIVPEEALKNFQLARGHSIERATYVDDLKNGCKGGSESHIEFPFKKETYNNRRKERGDGDMEWNSSKRRQRNDNEQWNDMPQDQWYDQCNSQLDRGGKRKKYGRMGERDVFSYNWRDRTNQQPPSISAHHGNPPELNCHNDNFRTPLHPPTMPPYNVRPAPKLKSSNHIHRNHLRGAHNEGFEPHPNSSYSQPRYAQDDLPDHRINDDPAHLYHGQRKDAGFSNRGGLRRSRGGRRGRFSRRNNR